MTDACCLLFHALSDATRQKIVELLSRQEMTVGAIVKHFKVSQPSISHHLDILKRANMVQSEKRGREVYYSLNRDEIVECCGMFFQKIKLKVSHKKA